MNEMQSDERAAWLHRLGVAAWDADEAWFKVNYGHNPLDDLWSATEDQKRDRFMAIAETVEAAILARPDDATSETKSRQQWHERLGQVALQAHDAWWMGLADRVEAGEILARDAVTGEKIRQNHIAVGAAVEALWLARVTAYCADHHTPSFTNAVRELLDSCGRGEAQP